MSTRRINEAWYTIEVQYFGWDRELKLHRLINVDTSTLKRFREDLFLGGMFIRGDGGGGVVVPPTSLSCIEITRQQSFIQKHTDRPPLK